MQNKILKGTTLDEVSSLKCRICKRKKNVEMKRLRDRRYKILIFVYFRIYIDDNNNAIK